MLEDGFYFLYADGTYHPFAAKLTRWGRYAQNPITAADLSFDCDPGVPLPPLMEVIFVRDGQHLFHGMIWTVEDKESHFSVTCMSMEHALSFRYIAALIYHEVSLNQLFSSDAPTEAVDIPGLLWRINSEIPSGGWTAYSATVAKLVGGGLKSQMGAGALYAYTAYPQATSIDGCDGVQVLSDAGTYPTAADQYYRTTDDLYVRLGDGSYLPNAFLVAAANRFDTKIRLGSCSIGTYKNTVDFAPSGQADGELSDIFDKAGLDVQFLPHTDGYIYLNMAAEISRGSASSPVKSFVDGQEGVTVALTSDTEPEYQAVIGLPDDESGTPQVVTDWSPSRIQLFRLYDVATSTNEEKMARIQAILDGQDVGLKIVAPIDYHLRIGDWISATHRELGTYAVRVQQIQADDHQMTIKAGKVVFVAADSFGEFIRSEVPDWADVLSETTIADPESGSFVIEKEDVNDALVIYYEESYQCVEDDSSISEGTFVDLEVNGKVVPPGRISLKNGGSVKIDITEYCSMSTGSDTTNTLSRNLYRATGWEGLNAIVSQWKALKFLAP